MKPRDTKAPETALEIDDLELPPEEPIPYLEILGTSALGFLHLGIGALFGLIHFGPGARYWNLKGFWDPAIHFVFFLAIFHFAVVLPFATLSRAQWENLGSRTLRVAVAAFLLGLPIFSFGYYRGGIKVPMDFQELFLNAFIPATVAALFYERVRRASVLTLAMALPAYLFLYVVSDFMTPTPVIFSVVPQGPIYYSLRALLPWSSLLLALWLTRADRYGEMVTPERIRNYSFALILVAIYGWMVQIAVPLVASRLDANGMGYTMNWDLGFAVTFVAAALLMVRKPIVLKILQGLCAVGISLWAVRLVLFFKSGEAGFSEITWATTALLVVTAMGALFHASRSPFFRQWFRA